MEFKLPFPIDRHTLFKGIIMASLAVTTTLLYLSQHMAIVDLGYRIEQSRDTLAALSHQRAELLVEVASLSSLARVERMAREQLGMVRPKPTQLVRVVPSTRNADDTPEADGPLMLAAARLP